ncbi:serine hydrolase [Micromonospora cremea]|uniref:serine hydrolase n=1 Tax=Micromonospora cremea TaxID=709881 RepID=UPI00117D21C1
MGDRFRPRHGPVATGHRRDPRPRGDRRSSPSDHSDGRHLVATSGVADRDTRRPVSPNGRFRIASTRKAFEATVVLQRASVIWIKDLTRTRAESRAGHRGA